ASTKKTSTPAPPTISSSSSSAGGSSRHSKRRRNWSAARATDHPPPGPGWRVLAWPTSWKVSPVVEQKTGGRPLVAREAFTTSRMMEYLDEKELVKQIGHDAPLWRLALIKELVDNALDACESAGVRPRITVKADDNGFSVEDNGPG